MIEPPALDSRALLVLQLLALGYSQVQIAQLLNSTADAVMAHERSVCAALGTSTTCEAVARALARGLIVRLPQSGRRKGPAGARSRFEAREEVPGVLYRVYDTLTGRWAEGHPAFPWLHLASTLAETLNERETARQQLRWLDEQDRQRGRK